MDGAKKRKAPTASGDNDDNTPSEDRERLWSERVRVLNERERALNDREGLVEARELLVSNRENACSNREERLIAKEHDLSALEKYLNSCRTEVERLRGCILQFCDELSAMVGGFVGRYKSNNNE